ncbi:NADP-dependent oxidoreductase [Verrucosispora sp. NA02020]|uniref:NADP-dependent oxidoreductase n=1 Tax=Verrucosispora sp. NA02020 TaxID=2742132 RepID=UPI003D755ADF
MEPPGTPPIRCPPDPAWTARRLPRPDRHRPDLETFISAIGSRATSLAVGDAVFGRTNKARLGALAEKVAIEADLVAPMPRTLDFTAAAAVPLAGTTALQAIRDALAVQADDRLLITGGSTMVGMFATTLAARTGAHVVTTASAASEPLLRNLGAAEVIDYRSRRVDAAHARFSRIFDLVGGPQVTALLELVSPGGRFVTITSTPTPGSIRYDYPMPAWRAAALEPALWLATLGPRRRARAGDLTYRFLSMRPSGQDLRDLDRLVDSGTLPVKIDSTYRARGTAPAAPAAGPWMRSGLQEALGIEAFEVDDAHPRKHVREAARVLFDVEYLQARQVGEAGVEELFESDDRDLMITLQEFADLR